MAGVTGVITGHEVVLKVSSRDEAGIVDVKALTIVRHGVVAGKAEARAFGAVHKLGISRPACEDGKNEEGDKSQNLASRRTGELDPERRAASPGGICSGAPGLRLVAWMECLENSPEAKACCFNRSKQITELSCERFRRHRALNVKSTVTAALGGTVTSFSCVPNVAVQASRMY